MEIDLSRLDMTVSQLRSCVGRFEEEYRPCPQAKIVQRLVRSMRRLCRKLDTEAGVRLRAEVRRRAMRLPFLQTTSSGVCGILRRKGQDRHDQRE